MDPSDTNPETETQEVSNNQEEELSKVDSPRKNAIPRSASHTGLSQSVDGLKIKKKYTNDELMAYRPQNMDLPEGHTSFPLDIIKESMNSKNNYQNKNAPGSPQVGRSPKPNRGGRGGQNQAGGGRGHKKSASLGNSGSGLRTSSGGRGGRGGGGAGAKVNEANLPPVAPLVASENRWIRPTNPDEKETIFSNARGILNKLTLEHFESLSEKFLSVGIDSVEILEGIIHLIFAKAIQEPHFSTMYADLCNKLSQRIPAFPAAEEGQKPITFRRLLIESCQQEFEGATKVDIDENLPQEQKDELEFKAKKKYLGNIRFIGELFKQAMLPEKIMHYCIESLLKDLTTPKEDDIESLCKLLTTVGKNLDSPAAAEPMNIYFQKLDFISNKKENPSRMRFMARDVIDLRNNAWVPRRKENEAKTLAAARAEVMGNADAPASPKVNIRKSDSQDFRSENGQMETGRGALRGSHNNVQTLKKSGGLVRSSSETSLDQVDSPSTNRRKGGKDIEKKPSQEGWEVVGNAKPARNEPKGRGGYGRGAPASPAGDRMFRARSEVYAPKEKAAVVNRGANIFSMLGDDSASPVQSGPKSALRKSSSNAVSSPSAPRKEVKITTPEEEPSFAQSTQNLENKVQLLLEEYLSSSDPEEAMLCLKDLNSPDYHGEVVSKAVTLAIEKKERDREEIIKLFKYLCENGLLKPEDFETGFTSVLEMVDDLDIDLPFASKYVAIIMANVMSLENSLPLSFLEHSVRHLSSSGKAANIVATLLDTLVKLKGQEAVVDMWKGANLNFAEFLKKDDRTPEKANEFLNSKGLSFITSQ